MSRFCWDSLLLCCIVLVGWFSAGIAGDEGGDYLDSKEAQVVKLSNQASDNYMRKCELLATCNNTSNCSYSVCEPLLGNLEDLTCTTVLNNTYCPAPENGITLCTSMYLDYKRGHVRDYDPRNRPWFRTSTSVVKVVTVLIDLAASMNSNVPTSFGLGSMLQVAKTIASQLLTTLTADDHVNMIVFHST